MTKIKMRDTTAHADLGQLLRGEVYEVPDALAEHLIARARVAVKAPDDAQTYAEKHPLVEEQPDEDDDLAPLNPFIAQQVEAAGTREGDHSESQEDTSHRPLSGPIHRGGARK